MINFQLKLNNKKIKKNTKNTEKTINLIFKPIKINLKFEINYLIFNKI